LRIVSKVLIALTGRFFMSRGDIESKPEAGDFLKLMA